MGCAKGYLFLFNLGITLDQECRRVLEDCQTCCTFEFCVLFVSVLMQESKSTWCWKLGIKGEQALSIYSNDAVATGDKICMSHANFLPWGQKIVVKYWYCYENVMSPHKLIATSFESTFKIHFLSKIKIKALLSIFLSVDTSVVHR